MDTHYHPTNPYIYGALDFSPCSPGMAKAADDKLICYHGIDTKHFKKNYIHRNISVIDECVEYLQDCKIVLIEGYAFRAKGRVIDIAEMCGSIKYRLLKKGVQLYTIAPKSVKKIFAMSGDAEKADVIKAVNTTLGIETDNDNVADALAIVSIAIKTFHPKCDLPIVSGASVIKRI